MAHQNEYYESLVTMLELIWGQGYMAPGGPGNVANLLDGIPTHGKRILDIGCGIGGPAFEMAQTHGAKVVGIDLEAPLIARARSAAKDLGLEEQCSFLTVEAGPLQFPDSSFDIVISSGALTQTKEKRDVLEDVYRILRPGGYVSCYDWLRGEPGEDFSEDMLYWFKMEGLTYALETLESYRDVLVEAGFTEVTARDASAWYRQQAHHEYELMRGPLYPRMVEQIGQEDADYFVEDWRSMVVVIDKGEMKQGYLRGRRPRDS